MNLHSVISLLLTVILSVCQNITQAQQMPANILFLLADDLGYNEIGSYGQTIIRTPELDKLAAQGMRFTSFYAGNAVCSPSRAVLLTGTSAANAAVRSNAGYFGDDKWEGAALDKDALRTDMAFEFLDGMDRDRPFFLFRSYRAPHSLEGPIRDTELYADQGWPELERVHAAKITLLDRQVGRLLNKLQEMGELDNTLVLFTSDNGPHFAPRGHDLEFFDSNGELKGGKRDLYEGGVRVPLIAYWQGRIPPEGRPGISPPFRM